MTQVSTILREYGVIDLAKHGHERARRGFAVGIRRALVEIERHHKRKEMIRGSRALRAAGGRLSSGDKVAPDPFRITNRTGNLSQSYRTAPVDARNLVGAYGSDKVYAPVHEFGSPAKNIRPRPGLQNTLNALDATIEKILADSTRDGIDGK